MMSEYVREGEGGGMTNKQTNNEATTEVGRRRDIMILHTVSQ